jgi:hypothetical protein
MSDENTAREVFTYDELYAGRFLKAGHLRGSQVTVAIDDVWTEELTGEKGAERKALLSFRGTDKQHVLPKINGECIKAMFGANVKEWVGKRVTLYATDKLMPMPTAKGDDRLCVRVFGSPDITAPVAVTYTPPRRRAIKMTMHPTGKPKAQPETGELLDGDALQGWQRKLRAMANECGKSDRAQGNADAYFAAAKERAGVESSKVLTLNQAQAMEMALRAEIEGVEPLL